MVTFGLIGAGTISKKHVKAIESIGGKIVEIFDPFVTRLRHLQDLFLYDFDYTVICSPSDLHYEHIKFALKEGRKVIVEKPQQLPWQPIIDNDDINIVLQYNWIDKNILPIPPTKVEVVMIRDKKYFESWKGDVRKTGGIFPLLFIHYIDLALRLGASFSGLVLSEGEQVRRIDGLDLNSIDMDELYSKMYHDIVFNNKGIKPKDTMLLTWIMERAGWMYGHGSDIIGKQIEFTPSDLVDLIK